MARTGADKRSIEEYLDQCRWIERITADDLTKDEPEEKIKARKARARKDFSFFVQYYFAHYAKCKSA